MIGATLCRAGIHKWRYCKRAVWPMEYVELSLDLSACARCGVIRREDADQLAYLEPIGMVQMEIEAIPHDQ